MKNLILFLLGMILCAPTLMAQNKTYPNAIHAKLNFNDFGIPQSQDLRLGEGFEVGYFRNVAPFLNVGFPLKIGLAKLPNTTQNTVTTSLDAVFHLENTSNVYKLVPYAFAGAGIFAEKFENAHVQIPVGAGLKIRVSEFAFLNIQGEYRLALADERNNLQLGLGFAYLLHKTEAPAAPVKPEEPSDVDQDGIPDILDKCPEEAGTAAALGCPDRDNDGIGDAEDNCPDEAGTIETGGCPDSDNDGFADADDECPDKPGTVRGCPDSDFDGFPDNTDECPDTPGRWNGCPDTDFDGVADKDDKCPDNPGPAENNGCPETNEPKDSDNDGVLDSNDECPTVAGTLNGCPDSDNDGVADKDDKCPDEPGLVANAGCPDAEIEIEEEVVPPPPLAIYEPVDSDGDGVPNESDPCPDVAGTYNGCPDSDGDGVADNLDRCPNTAGSASNRGCPEIKAETKQQLSLAMDAVQFNTGKSTLKSTSFDILDGVVEIMRQYPDYKLSISGHTDDVGDEERNLNLSRERAKACYDYLIFRGVKESRLRYAGFGEARPIASNDTAAGREKNRRVEFELTLD
ncbi:MAG: OmpA family protein [Saprospiraceae bacterium]